MRRGIVAQLPLVASRADDAAIRIHHEGRDGNVAGVERATRLSDGIAHERIESGGGGQCHASPPSPGALHGGPID